MPIIREADAVPHHLHGATFHCVSPRPASGSKELCAWRLEIAAGTAGQPHHVSHEEVLVLLTGHLTVTLDDAAPGPLSPGEAVLVPAGASFPRRQRLHRTRHRLGHHPGRPARHPPRRLDHQPALGPLTGTPTRPVAWGRPALASSAARVAD